MKRRLIILLLLLTNPGTNKLWSNQGAGQFSNDITQFSDFIYEKGRLIALANDGYVYEIDIPAAKKTALSADTSLHFNHILIDREGSVLASTSNELFMLQEGQYVKKHTTKHEILGITVDQNNHYYAFTESGLLDLSGDSLYFPEEKFHFNATHGTKTWYKAPAFFVDSKNNIWMSFGYGEWGGDLFIFDAGSKKYIKPDIAGFSITGGSFSSFTESNNAVYMSEGLMHFCPSGRIAKFTDFRSRKIFDSHDHVLPKKKNSFCDDQEYVGPVYYKNRQLYYYSQNGIHRGEIREDSDSVTDWKIILKPKLLWRTGQSNAVGSPMNLVKFVVLDNETIIFLSAVNGIGISKGKKIRFVK